LVVIITRVAHPSPRIVCGHMRRWAPIIASDEAGAVAVAEADPPERRENISRRHSRLDHEAEVKLACSAIGRAKCEAQKSKRLKQAQQ
jgi:hypothetical protein